MSVNPGYDWLEQSGKDQVTGAKMQDNSGMAMAAVNAFLQGNGPVQVKVEINLMFRCYTISTTVPGKLVLQKTNPLPSKSTAFLYDASGDFVDAAANTQIFAEDHPEIAAAVDKARQLHEAVASANAPSVDNFIASLGE